LTDSFEWGAAVRAIASKRSRRGDRVDAIAGVGPAAPRRKRELGASAAFCTDANAGSFARVVLSRPHATPIARIGAGCGLHAACRRRPAEANVMKTTLFGTLSSLVGLSFLAVACGHSYNTRSSTETTAAAAGNDPNYASIEKITMAKCDREERCDNVGQGKKFGTRQSCIDENRSSKRDDLRASECPGGIDQRQLEKCVAEIRAEHCGNVLDKVNRLTACRDAALCMN
jgi:hypothetical protein